MKREDVESLMLVGLDIDAIEGLERAKSLRRLYLSRNKLASMKGLQGLTSLETLHLEDNRISTFLDLLPLRSLPALRKLALERNPICKSEGFELGMLAALLPQITSVNGLNVTASFREDSAFKYQVWLHTLLCEHHQAAFEHAMPLLGSFVHQTLVDRATAWHLHPLAQYAESSLRLDKPHSAFYARLFELKRAFRLRQVEPPTDPLPGSREGAVKSPGEPRRTHKHADSVSSAQLVAFGSEDFV